MDTSRNSDPLLWVIGAFKLVKASLLLGFAFIAFRFAGLVAAPRDPLAIAAEAVAWLGAFPGRRSVVTALHRAWAIDPERAEAWGIASVVYAAVFLVEGAGLLLRRRWAEWLTVIVTASFVPIEVYELVRHFGPGKIVALTLNLAILAYLVGRRMRDLTNAQ